MMNVNEALEYIHSLRWMSKKLGLTKTEDLLARVGNPEKKLKFVHIGGTNGKGSTSAMLAECLREQGYKTGLFTSPFIMRFNERIMVSTDEEKEYGILHGFKEIPDNELAEITDFVKSNTDNMEEPPSEFEVVTVIGLIYFLRENCDIVVLEVGMGGELDATNVIPAPLAAVLVNIGLDHTMYLGDTVAAISKTKAGIIKQGTDVVFYGDNKEAEREIAERCILTGSKLIMPDFSLINVFKADFTGQSFEYKGFNIDMPMIGIYQRNNCAVVLETIMLLRSKGMPVSDENVYRGIRNTSWIARLERISDKPLAFVDGSHNPQGMRATIDTIKSYVPVKEKSSQRIISVFGVMADKEVDEMLYTLSEITSELVCVQPVYQRAMKCEDLYDLANRLIGNEVDNIYEGHDVQSGIEKALSLCKDNDILLLVGSLYMASEVRDYFKQKKNL